MNGQQVNLKRLFDADEYWRSGSCPWTFFAYPTALAVEHGLPADVPVRRFLGDVQASGIDVAIWVGGIDGELNYFACRGEDAGRLLNVIRVLESSGEYGEAFCVRRSRELLSAAQNRDRQDLTT